MLRGENWAAVDLCNVVFYSFIFEKDHSPLQCDVAMDKQMRRAMWFGKLIYETFRNASVIKSTAASTPALLTRPIECRPVGGRASVVLLYMYTQITFLDKQNFL